MLNDFCGQKLSHRDFTSEWSLSKLEISDLRASVKSAVEHLDCLLNFTVKSPVSTLDHLVISHDIVVERPVMHILGDHAANLGASIQERQVTVIIQVEVQ